MWTSRGPDGDDDGAVSSEALPALLHLDDLLGSSRAQPFLTPHDPGLASSRHHFAQELLFLQGGRPDLRAQFIREGVYAPGLRGWWHPPFR